MSNTEFRSFSSLISSKIFSEITKYLYIVCVCVCVMCFQFHFPQSSANTSLKFANFLRFNNIFQKKKNWSRFWFNKNQINQKKKWGNKICFLNSLSHLFPQDYHHLFKKILAIFFSKTHSPVKKIAADKIIRKKCRLEKNMSPNKRRQQRINF